MKTEQPSEYEKPSIADYGSLVEVTAASFNGNSTDAIFPAHTPRGSITFS
jgi:hypothetical protein